MAGRTTRDERQGAPRLRVESASTPREGFANYLPREQGTATETPQDEPSDAVPAEKAAEPDGSSAHGATAGGEGRQGVRHSLRSWLHDTFPGHENAVLWGFLGFVLALVFFALGFWRTLLVVLLVALGVAFGQALDGDPRIIEALRNLFRGDNGR